MSHAVIRAAEENNNFLIPNATFIVELLLFLIVLAVLAKFVLPRLQSALSGRRAMIAGQIKDAEEARNQLAEAERASALRPADGARTWERFQWFSWVESTPRLVDGVLYLGSSDNRTVRALDPADGRTLWSTDINGWAWAQPAVSAGAVFASSAGTADHPSPDPPEGSFSALDRRTGALKWRRIVPAQRDVYLAGFVGAPAVAGDRVIVGGLDGVLYAFPTGEKPNASTSAEQHGASGAADANPARP